jgi:hypothetical protein
MTPPKHKKSKHMRTLLKVYRMYLMNLPDEKILKAGITAVELQKCKQFHQALLGGKYFYMAGRTFGFAENISKNMFLMFEKWQSGSLSWEQNSLDKHPRIKLCFSMLLDGATDSELNEKCTPYEIEKAKKFMIYVNSDSLSSTIAMEVEIPRSTVKNLLKIYRERKAADGCHQMSSILNASL